MCEYKEQINFGNQANVKLIYTNIIEQLFLKFEYDELNGISEILFIKEMKEKKTKSSGLELVFHGKKLMNSIF